MALALVLTVAAEAPPPVLSRGINITHWFRFPPSHDPATLRAYLGDAELAELKRMGFTFVRVPVQPDLLGTPGVLADALHRVQRQGLATVVTLFGTGWDLETDPADRTKLFDAWGKLAVVLRQLETRLTYPELLNEPVFAGRPEAWAKLQHELLVSIRAILPSHTVVLTGAEWGGIAGLLRLPPQADRNVVYSIHMYEPPELTSLASYRSGVDQAALARLPFPVHGEAECAEAAASSDAATVALIRFYCAQRWDAATVSRRIEAAGEWGRRNHVGVIMGEFGASNRLRSPARLAWIAAVRAACEQQRIGWALWGYDDSMGFDLRPGREARVESDMLEALGMGRASRSQALAKRRPMVMAP
jgi:hypothetical protein